MKRFKSELLGLALAFVATASHAATCTQLQRQLEGASGGRAAAYERAIARQAVQIDRVKAMIRRGNCRSSSRGGACGTLTDSLRDMTGNMKGLRRSLARSGRRSARSIRTRMARKGCGRNVRADRSALERDIFGKVARRKAQRATSEADVSASASRPLPTQRRGGTYKTMCVRTCDGLAVPVSLATTASRFGDDARACSSMCPGTQMELYAMPVRSEDMSVAVNVANGSAYPQLATAFQFRKRYDAACSCRFDAVRLDDALLRPVESQPEADHGRSAIILPTPRPRDRQPAMKQRPSAAPNSRLRIIGEEFLAGRGSEEEVQARVRDRDRSTPAGGA